MFQRVLEPINHMSDRRILLFSDLSASVVFKHLNACQFYVILVDDFSDFRLSLSLKDQPDLILIDSDCSQFNSSLQLVQLIRSRKVSIPLVHLIEDKYFHSRVQSLQAGSDDVLSKPFALEELVARLDALFRRALMGINHLDGSVLRHADLELNTDTREVTRDGILVKLTVKEYDLMVHFLQYPEQVLPRMAILHNVWGQSWTGDENLLEVYIRYLRKKIERPNLDKLIHTVRGVGYMLR